MNLVGRYLQQPGFPLAAQGPIGLPRHAYTLGTPKARWCSITFLVFTPASAPDPALIVKLPRLADVEGCLVREAAALRQVHATRPGGLDGVPRLIAHEVFDGQELLVRTALPGTPYKPAAVRGQPEHVGHALEWLMDLHESTAAGHCRDGDAFARLVERPLARLAGASQGVAARELLTETHRLASVVRDTLLPQVFEHGDFGGRNLFQLPDGRLGVSDWEFAEPRGLPAVDLFFLLASVAFARRRARTLEARLAALGDAFFRRDAWTRPYVAVYAERLRLPRASLLPLFVLCWCRYAANLTRREQCAGERFDTADSAHRLEQSHHWRFWRFAVEHAHEFTFER